MAEQSNRVIFLDNLRAFVVMLVVTLHGTITYMKYPPQWWYVLDPQNSIVFTFLVMLVDIPIMMMMFFIAAYFLLPSALKRDPNAFLKGKSLRIGLPWILGALLLAPPTAYMTQYSRHVGKGLFQFWITDFWTKNFQQSVYWFLGVLFFFFVIFSLVCRLSPQLRSVSRRISYPSWKTFAAFWAIMTIGMFVLFQLGLRDEWFTRWYVLIFEPVRAPLYTGYFILGIIAYRDSWFTNAGYKPRLAPWAGLWALSGVLYLVSRWEWSEAVGMSPTADHAIQAALFNAFCLSSLMTGAAFFQRFVNSAGHLRRSLAESSYGMYYIHPLIMYPLAYLLIRSRISLYVKAMIVIGAGLAFSWTISVLVLRRVPGLRRMF